MGASPAVREFSSDVLEVVVAHILHAEDVKVRVLVDAFLNVGVDTQRQLFALFLCFGGVDYFCALGLRHRECRILEQ